MLCKQSAVVPANFHIDEPQSQGWHIIASVAFTELPPPTRSGTGLLTCGTRSSAATKGALRVRTVALSSSSMCFRFHQEYFRDELHSVGFQSKLAHSGLQGSPPDGDARAAENRPEMNMGCNKARQGGCNDSWEAAQQSNGRCLLLRLPGAGVRRLFAGRTMSISARLAFGTHVAVDGPVPVEVGDGGRMQRSFGF